MLRTPAVKVENLTKRFGAVTAVDGISFEIARGRCVGLLGGNGAGKTTTIQMILGLLIPTGGTVEVFGEDVRRHRDRILPRINFSSPYVELPHRLTIAENLAIYAELYEVVNPKARISEIAQALDLDRLMSRESGRLSAGQKTRVGLAKALLNSPALLLLDEPTASLDVAHQHAVLGAARRFASEGVAVLAVLHDFNLAAMYADRIAVMQDGALHRLGTPDEVLTAELFRDVFAVDAAIVAHPVLACPLVVPFGRADAVPAVAE